MNGTASITVSSGGKVYFFLATSEEVDYIGKHPNLMVDSNVSDIVTLIKEGAASAIQMDHDSTPLDIKVVEETRDLTPEQKEDVQSLIDILADVPISDQTKACSACGTSFFDFIMQEKTGCPNCWFDFKDTISYVFAQILRSRVINSIKTDTNLKPHYIGSFSLDTSDNGVHLNPKAADVLKMIGIEVPSKFIDDAKDEDVRLPIDVKSHVKNLVSKYKKGPVSLLEFQRQLLIDQQKLSLDKENYSAASQLKKQIDSLDKRIKDAKNKNSKK